MSSQREDKIMARATREDGKVNRESLPEHMEVFTVVEATIVDSLGAYCTAGQEAALTEEDAKKYHKLNLIQVALPAFKKAVKEKADASKPASDESAKAPSTAFANRRESLVTKTADPD